MERAGSYVGKCGRAVGGAEVGTSSYNVCRCMATKRLQQHGEWHIMRYGNMRTDRH